MENNRSVISCVTLDVGSLPERVFRDALDGPSISMCRMSGFNAGNPVHAEPSCRDTYGTGYQRTLCNVEIRAVGI